MPPVLDDVWFPELKNSAGPMNKSYGVVVGTGITPDTTTIEIKSKNSNKVWEGTVRAKLSGNAFQAEITRRTHPPAIDPKVDSDKNTETITVTVTNATGTSAPSPERPADVVP